MKCSANQVVYRPGNRKKMCITLKCSANQGVYRPGKGAFINTLVGGAGQNGGGAKKVLSYQKGGTKKFSLVKEGGQKSLVKLKV